MTLESHLTDRSSAPAPASLSTFAALTLLATLISP
jgi:hypothetical protein